MSGEVRIVRGALAWGVVAAVVGALVVWPLRGTDGAASVAIAGGLVLANAAAAAGLSVLAGRLSNTGAAMIALPSFAIRMSAMFSALIVLDGRRFIDEQSFAVAFCAALTLVLFLEARAWRRTPWIAMTFETKEQA